MSAGDALHLMVREKWQYDAACRGMGPENFYLDSLDPEYETKLALAVRVCGNCLVREECRTYAENRGELYCVWDGIDLENPESRSLRD